ncbi:hypothetical protein M9458_007470, partial [Cirrhinus mrigala]
PNPKRSPKKAIITGEQPAWGIDNPPDLQSLWIKGIVTVVLEGRMRPLRKRALLGKQTYRLLGSSHCCGSVKVEKRLLR